MIIDEYPVLCEAPKSLTGLQNDTKISISSMLKRDDGITEISLSTTAVALFVTLTSSLQGRFDSNSFALRPGFPKVCRDEIIRGFLQIFMVIFIHKNLDYTKGRPIPSEIQHINLYQRRFIPSGAYWNVYVVASRQTEEDPALDPNLEPFEKLRISELTEDDAASNADSENVSENGSKASVQSLRGQNVCSKEKVVLNPNVFQSTAKTPTKNARACI